MHLQSQSGNMWPLRSLSIPALPTMWYPPVYNELPPFYICPNQQPALCWTTEHDVEGIPRPRPRPWADPIRTMVTVLASRNQTEFYWHGRLSENGRNSRMQVAPKGPKPRSGRHVGARNNNGNDELSQRGAD